MEGLLIYHALISDYKLSGSQGKYDYINYNKFVSFIEHLPQEHKEHF